MISASPQHALRRWFGPAKPALSGAAALILLAGTPAHAMSPGKPSLCGAKEKTWFEAIYGKNGGAIAVCSLPTGGDPVGRIRVLRLAPASAGSKEPRPAVIAEARGKARSKVFTIRRYTRPRTTYLKFELKNKRLKTVIYDTFEQGQTDTRMKEIRVGSKAEPQEVELQPRTESLSLMGLEGVVKTLPFDE